MDRKPNWTEIFTKRPDLEPPGYKEASEIVRADNYVHRKKTRKNAASSKVSKFPSLKHGAT